ncbi:MAG: tetratricopeptide repeat protein [Spartobacteria bacterium]|nr:tetratricopeptide repeat protein [Spartobacteria bacterium]
MIKTFWLACVCLLSLGIVTNSFAQEPEVETLLNSGFDLLSTGDVAGARHVFIQVVQQDSGNIDALQGLASCLYLRNDYPRARRTISIITHRQPEHAYAAGLLGTIEYQEGNMGAAEAALLDAVRLNDDNSSFYNNLAVVLLAQGKRDEAMELLKKAMRIDDENEYAQMNMAIALLSEDKPSKRRARRYYKEALELGAEPIAELNALLLD